MIEFSENEEKIFQQTVEWLTSKLNNSPELIKPSKTKFNLNLYTRIFVNENGKSVYLTAKEFDLLELLVCNPNKVYSREALLSLVWGNRAMDTGDVRTVDVHVRRLREKIEPSPSDPKYVHTKWGVGYYFRAK